MSNRKPNPTQAAGILRRFLKDVGIELPHTAALEAVARIEGHTDWQAMAADQKRQADRDAEYPKLLQPEPGSNDNSNFVYVDNRDNKGAWVAIGNVSAYLKPTDEGVVVDLFALGAEDRGSETSTYLHYQEALDALCENLEVDEDEVAEWTKSACGLDFHSQTWARKADLAKQFAARPFTSGQPVGDRAEQGVSQALRYLHGYWDHIFRGTRTETTRIVFDRNEHAIVCMEIIEAGRWRLASGGDTADVQDSLLNANEEALDNPQGWGLEESDTPPLWAAAYLRSGTGS